MAETAPSKVDSASEERRVLILILESDPYIQTLQTAVLEPYVLQTVFAPDGESALAMARQLQPRLLIEDILVPKLDGLKVCYQLKSDPEARHRLSKGKWLVRWASAFRKPENSRGKIGPCCSRSYGSAPRPLIGPDCTRPGKG